MGWARLDDGFHDHPKVDGLSLAAVGLYTLCLTWAHRHRKTALIPGHIAESRVRKLAGRNADTLSTELLLSGLWEAESGIGGWVIHDFEDYLPKERDPDERREAGRRGAASRWQTDGKPDGKPDGNLPSPSMANPMANGMASDSSRASAPAFPTRPVPVPNPESPTDSQEQRARFAEFWDAYPRRTAKPDAERAWTKATKRADPEVIVAAARRYRDDRNREDAFTAHPATWLNRDGWNDPPLPSRAVVNGGSAPRGIDVATGKPKGSGWEYGM